MITENSREVIKAFATCFSNMDIEGIEKLLVDKEGEFFIQDEFGEDIEAPSKGYYLDWLATRFEDFKETFANKKTIKYNFDKCEGCSCGQQVVYFDDAMFPRFGEYEGGILMHGLMLQTRGEKIWRILFCYNFKYLEKYAD